MNYRKENDEVLYPKDRFVVLNAADLAFLKAQAFKNPRKRIRICTHQSKDDKVHEMFIVHTKDAYVRPHKHINRSESTYLIEGEVDVILFDDDGEIIKRIEMGPPASGKIFYYRSADPFFHTFCIKTDWICFYETIGGPFNRSDIVFPSWAPDGSDPSQVEKFIRVIRDSGS